MCSVICGFVYNYREVIPIHQKRISDIVDIGSCAMTMVNRTRAVS